MGEIEIRMRTKDLKGLAYFMGNDAPFDRLTFYIRPGGALLIGMNPYSCGILYLPVEANEQRICSIQSHNVNALIKTNLKELAIYIGDKVQVYDIQIPLAENNPKNIFDYIPRDISGKTAHYDITQLERFLKASRPLGGGILSIHQNGPTRPGVVLFSDRPDFCGLLMPLVSETAIEWPPSWLIPWLEETKQ